MKRLKIFAAALTAIFSLSIATAQTAQDIADKYAKAVKLVNEDKNYTAAIPIVEQVIKEGTAAGAEAATNVNNAKKLLPQLYYELARTAGLNKNYADAETNAIKANAKAKEYNEQTMVKKAEKLLEGVYLAQGGAFVKNKNYTAAAEVYAKGLKALPNNPTLEMYMGICYVDGGKKAEGYAIFKQIIEKGKTNQSYKRTAESAQKKMESYDNVEANKALVAKNYPQAVTLLTAILKTNPSNAQAQMMLIQAYNNMTQYDNVIAKGPAAAAVQSDAKYKSDIFFMIGQAYVNKQLPDKAIENFKKVTSGNNVTQAKTLITELSKK